MQWPEAPKWDLDISKWYPIKKCSRQNSSKPSFETNPLFRFPKTRWELQLQADTSAASIQLQL